MPNWYEGLVRSLRIAERPGRAVRQDEKRSRTELLPRGIANPIGLVDAETEPAPGRHDS